jgi:hypothetical protein
MIFHRFCKNSNTTDATNGAQELSTIPEHLISKWVLNL